MNKKDFIILLASVATIVSCVFGIILGAPPALIALRQLQSELFPSAASREPTQVPITASSPLMPTAEVLRTLPSTDTPQLPTVTPVQPTATTRPPTARVVPTDTPRPPAIQPTTTSSCVQGNVIGRVEDDIPGTKICMGKDVSSIVDSKTRRRDVYAIDLVAGQQVRFSVNPSGYLNFYLYNLGSKTIIGNDYSTAFSDGSSRPWTKDYIPAVSGTYYFSIVANDTSQTYTFRVSLTGTSVSSNQGGDDIPGTKLALGNSVSSVLDSKTRRREVYAIDLVAGQEVRFNVTPSGYLNFYLYNPGSKSITNNNYSTAFSDGSSSQWVKNYTPTVSGTYYFSVVANDTSQTYTLSVKVFK